MMESQMEMSFQPLPHCVEEQGLLILHLFYVAWQNNVHLGVYHFPISKLPIKMLILLLLLFLPSLLSSKSPSFRKTTDTIQLQADESSRPNACICSLWAELRATSLNLPTGVLSTVYVAFPLQMLGKERSWRYTKRHVGSKELSKAISFSKKGTSEPREGW